MPRRPGTSVYKVNVRGAGRVARDFSRAQRRLQDELIAEMRDLGDRSRRTFRAHAPRDTGQLAEHIDAVPYLRAVRPRVSIRVAPLQGHEGDRPSNHDYLDVTRFGHRTNPIRPTQARALKVHLLGHRNAQFYVFRSQVRGVGHPSSADVARAAQRGGRRAVVDLRRAARPVDWVAEAGPALERLAAESERRLGRRVGTRLLR